METSESKIKIGTNTYEDDGKSIVLVDCEGTSLPEIEEVKKYEEKELKEKLAKAEEQIQNFKKEASAIKAAMGELTMAISMKGGESNDI